MDHPTILESGEEVEQREALEQGNDIQDFEQSEAGDEVASNADPTPFYVTDESMALLHEHYGEQKPDFARLKGGIVNAGDRKEVILADEDGQKPKTVTQASLLKLTAREWSDRYVFWTLELDGHCLIVKYSGLWRAWLGSAKTSTE
ncbi:MAG: hypothetical protein Q9218_007783 [Villophora microphyllina]